METEQKVNSKIEPTNSLQMNSGVLLNPGAHTHYDLVCRDKDGNIRWEDTIDNIVVTAGLNKLLDACFKAGLAVPAWYIGLVGATHTYAAGDIMSSHVGWAENVHYTGNRKVFNVAANTISGGSLSNSNNQAVFVFAGTALPDVINGAFLCNQVSGVAGTLYGEGDLTAPRSVFDGDTLTVRVTLTITP
jgi:hypothetical protein